MPDATVPDTAAPGQELGDLSGRLAAMEQQLEYMRQQQETLLYTLSHDLRTPVMTILGFTDMLIGDLKEGSEDQLARQYLEHIRNSATRQATLIESLLGLSRLQRQLMRPELLNLTELAEDYWQGQSQAVAREHVMQLLPTPAVLGDKAMLSTLMQALLDNALKFTSKHATPSITFGVEQRDGETVFLVRDNGVGFDEKRAERLFQPFRRLHSNKDFDGIGMGLATCALVVQRHGGRLWAESAIGKGTTIFFTLHLG